MNSVFYAIADVFGAFFKILPHIAVFVNLFFVLAMAACTIGWITYMIKHQDEEKGFNH
jgi:hypothetical protein